MSFDIQQLLRPAAPPGRGTELPRPRDAGFAPAFSDLLVGKDLVDPAAVGRARRAAEAASERFDLVLVKLGLISEADLCLAYATYCGLPLIETGDLPARPVLGARLHFSFLKTNRFLPISFDGRRLLIATADPFVDESVQAISYMLDVRVDLAVIAPAEIERALRTLYQDAASETQPGETDDIAISGNDGSEFDVERLRDIANEAPVIRLVNQIIARAVERGASDVHIEPGRDAVAVRFRVDGFLQQERLVPATLRAALTTRVKIMAKLDIAERRLPQDGRIKTVVRGVEIDIRVSTLPTVFGESVVMRILDRTRVELDFTKLGLDGKTQACLQRLMALPNGIVLVTGPTGSGKTTTLYTALKDLNRPELKLFTVEDPIEYQLSGINQIQVQPQIGLDFPMALRSILRQDPDIVMIGEIRDLETARIAIQAALTGHLVFSTLHTNTAAAAITRLIDMGIENYLLASTVKGVLAQRLVRNLCQHCKEPHENADHWRRELLRAIPGVAALGPARIHQPRGCAECCNIGFAGRSSIAEILVVNADLHRLILTKAPEAEID